MINKRILKLVNYIEPYKKIADVGCDHGYLIDLAFKEKNIIFAQAIDNKEGPLRIAQKNLQQYTNVSFSLSNGLEELNEIVEVVIIAGMGGITITEILKKNPEKLNNLQRLIIQANRDQYLVRNTLMQLNWEIIAEEIFEDSGQIYELVIAKKGQKLLTENELLFGPFLLKEKSEIFIKKWSDIQKKLSLYSTSKHDYMLKQIQDILR